MEVFLLLLLCALQGSHSSIGGCNLAAPGLGLLVDPPVLEGISGPQRSGDFLAALAAFLVSQNATFPPCKGQGPLFESLKTSRAVFSSKLGARCCLALRVSHMTKYLYGRRT